METEKCNRYYSLGCSSLETIGAETKILNITDGGLDGIGIGLGDFGKITEWKLKFKPFEIGSNNNVGITHFGIDGYGRKKIKMQQAFYFDEKTNRMTIAFNSKLLPDNVLLVAENKGQIVFQGKYLILRNNPCINWWPIAVAFAVYIADSIDYSHKTETGPNGTTTTDEVSWNSKSSTKIQTVDGVEFETDRMFLLYKNQFSIEEEKNIVEFKEVQITATNYKELTIIDEKYCC